MTVPVIEGGRKGGRVKGEMEKREGEGGDGEEGG